MLTAQFVSKKTKLAAAIFVAAALVFSFDTWAVASGLQNCTIGSSCSIGEFLYDDNYAPITTDYECTITSRYPNGSPYLESKVMTSASDGWYSYTFTTPSTTGVYRTQVCCTAGSDHLCLDKSFEVSSAADSSSDIASAVWGYSSRTLSGFGTLVADIWNNTTRTLTGASLSSGSLATKAELKTEIPATVTNIQNVTNQNRLLLEQLVNKPIIQNFLEETTPDLGAKIEDSKAIASRLSADYQLTGSRASLIISKWRSLPERELLDEVLELSSFLGEENDSSSIDSIFGQINWLKDAWEWEVTDNTYNQTKAVKKILTSVQSQLGSYGKSEFAYLEMKSLASYFKTLDKLVGDSADTSYHKTLFGRLRQVQDLAKVLDSRQFEIDKILANWETDKYQSIQDKTDNLLRKIMAVNKVPRVNIVLASTGQNKSPETKLKNKLLGMDAIIDANRLLLARGAGKPLSNTWLEVGSIVFKSLITNPSGLISQTVPLKYYLPSEVREEHIIETDEDLTVGYDAEKDQYYVSGEFILGPGKTKTVSVTVDDIWVITNEELDSLRCQAEELSRPLEKTSFFAQGVTLKSDIDVSLDKIISLQKSNTTPEAKIRAHREAKIELEAVKVKMDKLQELVTQAGSTGTLFGFIGGAQTLAVWGLIIIMVTGFVFLVIYMRKLGVKEVKEVVKTEVPQEKKKHSIKTVIPFFIVALLSSATSGILVSRIVLSSGAPATEKNVLGCADSNLAILPSLSPSPSPRPESSIVKASASSVQDEDEMAVGGPEIVRVSVPEGSAVNVRKYPSLKARILTQLKTTTEAIKIGEDENWVNLAFEENEESWEGWVHSEFIEEGMLADERLDEVEFLAGESATGGEEIVRVSVPEGSAVNIRQFPSLTARILTQFKTTTEAIKIGEDENWVNLAFGREDEENREGWVYSEFVEENPLVL